MNKPYLIKFDKIGNKSIGYISVAESVGKNIPFEIKRVYWTYYTPNEVNRGFHAHRNLAQVITAVSGVIELKLENKENETFNFILDSPSIGLYIPKLHWREISFSHNAVLMCLASESYNECDYIRNYQEFLDI
ncbi:MAG: hypothetical protein ACI9Z4_000685 [Polaribacter sp.]|jgi:hypothetical protein